MRILLVHNYYAQRGGEDVVFEAERDLLRMSGYEVFTFTTTNDRIADGISRVLAGVGVVFSPSSFIKLVLELRRLKPDVVHVHNFFPLISPAVFYACRLCSVPVVQTLHNYRLICPSATLVVNGKVTEKSVSDGPWWTVPKRVYRSSMFATACVALMIAVNKAVGTWARRVDRYLALTEFGKEIFVRSGISADRIVVKPNFAPEPSRGGVRCPRRHFLFVGRLTKEKGVKVLAAAAKDAGAVIRYAGEGPLRDELLSSGAMLLGQLTPSDIEKEMLEAIALVIPSTWYEGFPRVVAEAMSLGVPIIASDIGALREIVEQGRTGFLVSPGDVAGLAAALTAMQTDPLTVEKMGVAARERYQKCYSPNQTLRILSDVYNDCAHSPGGKC